MSKENKKEELQTIDLTEKCSFFTYAILPILFFLFMSITTLGLIIVVCSILK